MLERRRASGCVENGGAYPERADLQASALDAACARLWSRIAPAVGRPTRRLLARVAAVEARDTSCRALTDEALRTALVDLRMPMLREGLQEERVVAAFAYLREASRRTIGLRHHRVQVMGAFVLLDGKLAELQTGEGKTIVAGMAAATAALAGLPTHVVTVSDYLASRDADLLRPLFAFAGLSVGAVRHDQSSVERQRQYRCDVTYVSNQEVAFDYLRDRVAMNAGAGRSLGHPVLRSLLAGQHATVLRGLHFAIVDEADSIMIDEARTPLILARPAPVEQDLSRTALSIAGRLIEDVHFAVQPATRQIRLTSAGGEWIEQALQPLSGFWRARRAREDLIGQALAALHLYRRDRDYVVTGTTVQIVDEHTGRIAAGRSWQRGLHQIIEMIEGVPPSDQNATLASITYQSFFRRYLKLAGMSGTLAEVAAESRLVYDLPTIRIPTHRPAARRRTATRMMATADAKWDAVAASARVVAATSRPVLIGTRSVASSEHLSRRLTAAGLAHVVLNARHDADEAAIVAEAGRAGRITVATNMAGRGTDIRPEPCAIRSGGLHVILTELHESRRIDRQLIGRGGRQGDPSTFETCLSLDDDLLQRHAPAWAKAFRTLAALIGVSATAAAVLRWYAQANIERQHRAIRDRAFHARHRLQDELAFAGAE